MCIRIGCHYLLRLFMTKKKRKATRLEVPIDVFYRCPKCDWIGYCVTDRYYLQCAKCNCMFGWRGRGRSVTREIYDKRFENT